MPLSTTHPTPPPPIRPVRRPSRRWLLLAALGWGVLPLTRPAEAATAWSGQSSRPRPPTLVPPQSERTAGPALPQAAAGQAPKAKGGKPKSAKKAKTTPTSGSEESRSDRERRLLRECAGRPNAGACEGYTR